MRSKFREPFNGFTHLGGAIAALIGGSVLLLIGGIGSARFVSLLIYIISLIMMLSASAVYHLVNGRPNVMVVLRKIDHSAIFLLIAGSYTPFCVTSFTGFWRWGFLAIIWGIALIGITVKVFYIRAPRWLNAGFYILMGWMSVLAINQMIGLPTWILTWLIIGGVIYTLGAVVYISKIFDFKPGKFGFHEVWHLFVLGGALSHFIAVSMLVRSIN